MFPEYARRKSLIPELRPAYWRARLEAWRLEVSQCEIAALSAIRMQRVDPKLRQRLSDEAEGIDRDVSILGKTLSAVAGAGLPEVELSRSFQGLSVLSERLSDTVAAVTLVRDETLAEARVSSH